MKVWILAILIILSLFLVSCKEALNNSIYEESCVSDKPVPIKCEKFKADDYSKTIVFSIREIDKVNINYTTVISNSNVNCERKSLKSNIGYYTLTLKCDDFYNQNISGSVEFDYEFMGKPKHTTINFVRKFGKKDPIFDRKPLDSDTSDSDIFG